MTAPFLDTNILVYLYSSDVKAERAEQLISRPFIVGVQTLNEFAYAARRKLMLDWQQIGVATRDIQRLSSAVPATEIADIHEGIRLAERHNIAMFDALMLAIALRAECRTFYTEDMHHGLLVDGTITVTNPFA